MPQDLLTRFSKEDQNEVVQLANLMYKQKQMEHKLNAYKEKKEAERGNLDEFTLNWSDGPALKKSGNIYVEISKDEAYEKLNEEYIKEDPNVDLTDELEKVNKEIKRIQDNMSGKFEANVVDK